MSYSTESRISRTTAATGTATHTRYSTADGGRAVSVVVWALRVWHAAAPRVVGGATFVWQTVTPAGWLAVVAVLGLPAALALGWVELAAAGVLAAVLLVSAVPFLFGGRAYSVELTIGADRVVAGDVIRGTVTVTNSSTRLALPGRVDIPTGGGIVEVHVPLLRAGHAHGSELTIAATRRGIISVGPVTSVRSDPLGMLKREIAWVDLRDIVVHPVTASVPSTSAGFIKDLEGRPSSAIVASDISFHAIREYAPGDAQRSIHWKSTAKTGTLMVRQFEETRRSRLAVVLSVDAAEYASPDEFELAVSAAASLGVRAIRDSRDLAVVTSDRIPEFVRASMRSIRSLDVVSARTLLDDLSGIESHESTMPIEEVSELASQVVGDLSIALVVCGSGMTPRRLQSVAVKFPRDVAVVAVVCDETAQPAYRTVAGLSVMTIGLLGDLAQLMARSAR